MLVQVFNSSVFLISFRILLWSDFDTFRYLYFCRWYYLDSRANFSKKAESKIRGGVVTTAICVARHEMHSHLRCASGITYMYLHLQRARIDSTGRKGGALRLFYEYRISRKQYSILENPPRRAIFTTSYTCLWHRRLHREREIHTCGMLCFFEAVHMISIRYEIVSLFLE